MVPRKASLRTLILGSILSCLFLLGQSTLTEAGCGCDKPPPEPAEIRPQATYAGTEVTIFHPDLRSGQTYIVAFTPGGTSERVFLQAQAIIRRDLADGEYKPQLVVTLPELPLGPASIGVGLPDKRGPFMWVTDDHFTVVPQPIPLPGGVGEFFIPDFQAAVSRQGIVYIALDVSSMQDPRTFQGWFEGYPLRFTHEDVVFYNTQGYLMQLLDEHIPGLSSLQASDSARNSDILYYSRHEFNTFLLQHEERKAHSLDPQDPNWHVDGTPHIDHDHLVIAIAGHLNNRSWPEPGATSAFNLEIHTFSFFHNGLFGDAFVKVRTQSSISSFNSKDGSYGSEGDVLSNGEVILTSGSVVDGDATAFDFRIRDDSIVTGEMILATEPMEYLPVDIPDSLEDLGKIVLREGNTLTLGPGSYKVSHLIVNGVGSQLFIDNAEGPVTIYVTGRVAKNGNTRAVAVTQEATISVADPNPEKFAVYVAEGNVRITRSGSFYGVVYAPLSLVTIKGGGEFFGSFVGHEVRVIGGSAVYYDIALRGNAEDDTDPGSDSGYPDPWHDHGRAH